MTPVSADTESERMMPIFNGYDSEKEKLCPMCDRWVLLTARRCDHCNFALAGAPSGKRKAKSQEESKEKNVPLCAKCGSSALHVTKAGFSVSKAILGTMLLGPLGAVGGAIGSNELKIVCLECGLVMKPGGRR
jgi:hypothetical protein